MMEFLHSPAPYHLSNSSKDSSLVRQVVHCKAESTQKFKQANDCSNKVHNPCHQVETMAQGPQQYEAVIWGHIVWWNRRWRFMTWDWILMRSKLCLKKIGYSQNQFNKQLHRKVFLLQDTA